ncbi:unnamed protein product [Sphagnum jensenii]
MFDIVTETDANEEATPNVEVMGAANDEELEAADIEQRHQKNQIRYYKKQQQLELVLVAQELSEIGGHEVDPTVSGDEDKCGVEIKRSDIWQDMTCLALLREGMLPEVIDPEEGKTARKRADNYCWKEQKLFFKDLADNCLNGLTDAVDDEAGVEHVAAQFLEKELWSNFETEGILQESRKRFSSIGSKGVEGGA